MTPLEELRKQRETLMAGRWVKYGPVLPMDACLLRYRDEDGRVNSCPSPITVRYVNQAWHDLGYDQPPAGVAISYWHHVAWNDLPEELGGAASVDQVIEVLDRAIKYAETRYGVG